MAWGEKGLLFMEQLLGAGCFYETQRAIKVGGVVPVREELERVSGLLKATELGSGRGSLGPGKVSGLHNSKSFLPVIGAPAVVQLTVRTAPLENQVCLMPGSQASQ